MTSIILGVLSIFSGILKWSYPSIFGYLRRMPWGEILNSAVWIAVGTILIVVSFEFLV